MSRRQGGNRNIRGPQSALTDFLAANNISAAQIRDDYERRRQQGDQQENAGEGASAQTEAGAEAETPPSAVTEDEEDKKAKRKKLTKAATEKIKKQKAAEAAKKKKGKKRGSDEDDEDDEYDEEDFGMYKKARPAPGQFEHCELCNKRFTVTPYSKEGPEGGLLCTPCGKEFAKDMKKEKRAAAPKTPGRKRRKLESDRLDGMALGGAKTLQQLCIEKVAKHHEDLEELGDLPQPAVERLSEIFSKKRVMKPRTLRLFLRPDLQDVVVHDAAYLEPEDYHQIFAVVPNMRRLVLGNACQLKDPAIDYMLERCHKLEHLQIYAGNLVNDEMWCRVFAEMGPRLKTVKLKWLDASFDDAVLQELVTHCQSLERVKLELCRRIGEPGVSMLAELPNLKHLSLQIGREVSNETLCNLIRARGPDLRTLSLEKFIDADDEVLCAIYNFCGQLTKLRFSENDTATDAGYVALFDDWQNPPLTFIDVNSTRDIDNNNPEGPEQAIGIASDGFKALMAHSGSALKHLDISSCRHIKLGAFMDVFNGAQSYPALEYINISFCNRVDTSVVAGIFKSCPALKQLVAFGCFDVQDVVVPRSISLIGVPRAQDAIEQFGVGIDVEEAIGRMVEIAVY